MQPKRQYPAVPTGTLLPLLLPPPAFHCTASSLESAFSFLPLCRFWPKHLNGIPYQMNYCACACASALCVCVSVCVCVGKRFFCITGGLRFFASALNFCFMRKYCTSFLIAFTLKKHANCVPCMPVCVCPMCVGECWCACSSVE